MKTDDSLYLFGCASFTYMWLEVNLLFFGAIADLTHEHNEDIRRQAIEEYEYESEDESEDELFQNLLYTHTMSDNKLVKSILDAATITDLVAGIGWIGKKKKQ